MVLDIVQAGDPVLREQAALIDPVHIGTPEFNELIQSMIETMRDAPGVGLAAPQVGLGIQLVVIEDREETIESIDEERREAAVRTVVPLTVLINPTLEPIGDELATFYEGCLSVRGYAAEVSRFFRVRVKALNEHGEEVTLEWEGWPARILQHEIDHLNGNLYVDRMDSRTLFATAYEEDDDDEADEDPDD